MARMRKSRSPASQNIEKKRGRGRPRKTPPVKMKPQKVNYRDHNPNTEDSATEEEEAYKTEEEYNSDSSSKGKRNRQNSANKNREENELEKQIRLAIDRERVRLRRANETEEERRKRLDADRERSRLRRQNETPEQRAIRLTMDRERNRLRRLNMSEAERQAALIADKEAHRLRREHETEEERKKRLAENKERIRQRRLNMTPEERKADRLARSAQIRNARALLTLGEMERLYRLALVRERNRLKKIILSPEERAEQINGSKESAYAKRKNETESQYQERLVKLRREWVKFILLRKFHDVVNVPDDGSMDTSMITDDIKSDEESLNKEYVSSLLETIRERKVLDDKEKKYFQTLSEEMKTKLKLALDKLQLEKATSIVKEMMTPGLSLDPSSSETEESMDGSAAAGPASVFPNSVYTNETSEDEDSNDIVLDETSGALIIPPHLRTEETLNNEMQNMKCATIMSVQYSTNKPLDNEVMHNHLEPILVPPLPPSVLTNPNIVSPHPSTHNMMNERMMKNSHPIMAPQFSHINRHLLPHMNPVMNPCMQSRLPVVSQPPSMEGHLPYGYECSVVDQMRATLNASIHLADSSATMEEHCMAQEGRLSYMKDHTGAGYGSMGEHHYSNHC